VLPLFCYVQRAPKILRYTNWWSKSIVLTYNLTIGPSRLLSKSRGPVFKPIQQFQLCLIILYHEPNQPPVHYILGQYYHRRFLARLTQHCASTIPLRTKSTQNSAIYKLMAEIYRCDMQFDHRPLTSLGYILWPNFWNPPDCFPYLGIYWNLFSWLGGWQNVQCLLSLHHPHYISTF